MKNEAQRSDESDFMQLLDAVHCMDNCKGMMLLPDESIDLVVTSPPYDDLRTYGGHSWDFYGVAWNLARVLKPGGVIVWVVNDATIKGSETGTSWEQASHFKALGLNLHDTMIWHKKNPPPQTKEGRRYTSAHEYIFILSKGKPSTFNCLMQPCSMAGASTNNRTQRTKEGESRKDREIARKGKTVKNEKPLHSVVSFANTGSKEHPAAFPLALVKDQVKSWSNKGDIVLDPFMGSGTTAKAAQELGRHYIGFEINPEYVEICQRRTAQATLGI